MHNVQAIILAAGKSTRFKTGKSKLLEKICGQEVVLFSVKLFQSLNIPMTIVVGFQKDEIINKISEYSIANTEFITQENQQGTGHAVQCTKDVWHEDNILIMNADVPLITKDIVQRLYKAHETTNSCISFITSHNTDATAGYGRVITKDGITKIVEARDFTGDAHEDCCINAGIYLIRRSFLETYINQLEKHENKQEFYLTDLVALASRNNLPFQAVSVPFDHVRGVNTLNELWASEQVQRAEVISHWMSQGVRFSIAQNVHVDLTVSIGAGTTIGSGVQLRGATTIGKNCVVGDFSIVENSLVAEKSTIHSHSVVTDSKIETLSQIGPFAHVRNHSIIGPNSVIGNFVEVKKSVIGKKTKAKHLSYLGDAKIGEQVNIGAGTITCNHNGMKKNITIIHDEAYIGSNNSLVAPVTIGKLAYTAAGSTITEDVPSEALGIARARQTNKEGYAKKVREKKTKQEEEADNPAAIPFKAAIRTTNDSSL
jgi:bifunctional UDP-N-acetylglucosamine pyrophosphorylase/glucosamine-1-phosphate N-acetyltransferase